MDQGVPSTAITLSQGIMFEFQNSPVATKSLQHSKLPMFGQLAMAAMILTVTSLTTGCSSLPSALTANGLLSESAESPVASSSQDQYLVDMQMSYGGTKKFKGNIGPGTTVQSAIEASGATKKFRNMDVAVMRKVEGDFQPLKMSCSYNSAKKWISPETDYALQHGDRIMITPHAESQLLQMLGTFTSTK